MSTFRCWETRGRLTGLLGQFAHRAGALGQLPEDGRRVRSPMASHTPSTEPVPTNGKLKPPFTTSSRQSCSGSASRTSSCISTRRPSNEVLPMRRVGSVPTAIRCRSWSGTGLGRVDRVLAEESELRELWADVDDDAWMEGVQICAAAS